MPAFLCRLCKRQTSGTFLPSRLTGAVYHNFLTKSSPRSVARCVSADYDPFMLHAWGAPPYFLRAFRTFLHNNVFPDEMDHQHGLLITLIWIPYIFISDDIWSLLFNCYRSQRRPGLETANTEWIVGDSYEAWNLPASLAMTVQTRNFVCWSRRWTLECFLPSSGIHAWEGLSVFIKNAFLVLWCSFVTRYVFTVWSY